MNPGQPFRVRRFQQGDAEGCFGLFRKSVHHVCSKDYSPDQIHAWAPLDGNHEEWAIRFHDRFAYVAVNNAHDQIIGFTDMTRNGYLDRLFVSPDFQRNGIARALFSKLHQDARSNAIREITTEASITARPFFESMNFEVVEEQSVICHDVALTNYRMRRVLDAQLA